VTMTLGYAFHLYRLPGRSGDREDRDCGGRQQSAYVIEASGQVQPARCPPDFTSWCRFMERICVQAQPQGNRDRHRRADLHHARQRAGGASTAVLYMQVMDPHLASYGITNYGFAISQLAQTTLRSEIGKIELDRTFEARGQINHQRRQRIGQGIVSLGRQGFCAMKSRNITPPKDVLSGDGEAKCAPEREKARRHSDFRGRKRREDQRRGRATKQRVIKQSEGQQTAADQ